MSTYIAHGRYTSLQATGAKSCTYLGMLEMSSMSTLSCKLRDGMSDSRLFSKRPSLSQFHNTANFPHAVFFVSIVARIVIASNLSSHRNSHLIRATITCKHMLEGKQTFVWPSLYVPDLYKLCNFMLQHSFSVSQPYVDSVVG